MRIVKTVAVLFFLTLLVAKPQNSLAKTAQEIQEEIKKYEQELERLSSEVKTLSNQIQSFDTQIRVTELKISETEEKISLLSGRIIQLEVSLEELSKAFAERVSETYKIARLGGEVIYLIAAPDLNKAVSRYYYLQKIQEFDRTLLIKLQEAQNSYTGQKLDQEELKLTLEEQKITLDRQKKAKAFLLAVTKNDEKRYQELLASARAELAVVLGGGKEAFLRDVKEGDLIGRIIPSASGCSSGQHLHFEVHKNGNIEDPNNYLRPISFSYDYAPDQYGYYGTINPHGGWNWPMNEPIQINQGFGTHGFAKTFYPTGAHNGIDMDSNSSTQVKAVKSGKLYGGSIQCGGTFPGTLLYAKVEQSDGIITWYLHTTPQ